MNKESLKSGLLLHPFLAALQNSVALDCLQQTIDDVSCGQSGATGAYLWDLGVSKSEGPLNLLHEKDHPHHRILPGCFMADAP